MSGDLWQEPSVVAWANHVLETMLPALKDSEISCSIVPDVDGDHGVGDVKYWVEIGASLCLGKPLMLVVLGEREIPPKLAAVADEIVRLPDGVNLASSEELARRIEAMCEAQS